MKQNNKKWLLKKIDEELAEKISKDLKISNLNSKILVSRGITDYLEIKKFLDTDVSNLINPFKLKDLEISIERILKAINNSETILIFGDYDVDGVTSTVILTDFLRKLNKNIVYYLPDREKEGYGLTIKAIDNMIDNLDKLPDLIVTVDCGITSINEVKYLKDKGIDTIITDHHQCKEELPNAYAVINPNRNDCTYPFKNLAGVGVAFKLIHGLCIKLNLNDLYLEYIDIVALGTVADVVPIIGENRIIVKNGIDKMYSTNNIGLEKLMDVSQVLDKKITTYTIAFQIAPKINAAGRIGDANRSVELFLNKDEDRVMSLAKELNKENKYRQEEEQKIIEEVISIIERDEKFKNKKILVLAKEGWHHGIIGIVASKIVEKYYKPCIIFSIRNEECKGSARSIDGFNIHNAILHCKDLTVKFGGHKQAAGLTVKEKDLEKFIDKINIYTDEYLNDDLLIQKIVIDGEITKSDMDIEKIREISFLEPFGFHNPPPSFLYTSLNIKYIKSVGNNKHLKITFLDENLLVEAIAFNLGQLKNEIEILKKLDVVCSLDINSWNGRETVQLGIKDYKKNLKIISEYEYYKSLDNLIVSLDINEIVSNDEINERHLKNEFEFDLELIKNEETIIIINCLNCLKKIKSMLKCSVISGDLRINYNYLTNDDIKCKIYVNPILDDINYKTDKKVFFYGCSLHYSYYKKLNAAFYNKIIIINNDECNILKNEIKVDRNIISIVYKLLKREMDIKGNICINDVCNYLSSLPNDLNINFFNFKNSVEILSQIKLIFLDKQIDNTLKGYMNLNNNKKKLEDSELYRKLDLFK
ncbi:MAG: single-stranded-DNA-specific exonuclease RecJ [Clostridiales bacterium]